MPVGRGRRRQETVAAHVHRGGTRAPAVYVVVTQELGRQRGRVRFGERGRGEPVGLGGQPAAAQLRPGRRWSGQAARVVDHVHAAADGRPAVGVVGRGLRLGAVAREQVAGKTAAAATAAAPATHVAARTTSAGGRVVVVGRPAQSEEAAEIAVVGPQTERHARHQRQLGGQGERRQRQRCGRGDGRHARHGNVWRRRPEHRRSYA